MPESYKLKNVLVTSYNFHFETDEDGNDVPMESFSLNYEEIKWTYTEHDQRGKKKRNVEYTWTIEEGTAISEEPESDPAKTETIAVLDNTKQ